MMEHVWKKNEIITVTITDIAGSGEGIGRFEGCTFFVKDAIVGDTVKAVITRMKKGYGYAKTTEVLAPSADRILPACANAKRCGGCQLMEMRYEKQLAVKEKKVRDVLRKIGGLAGQEIFPIIGMQKEQSYKTDTVPLRYRNKMQFPFGRDKEGNILGGFYAGRTHAIIDVTDCMVAPRVSSQILHAVKAFLNDYHISVYNEATGQGLVRHLVLRTGYHTGEIMVCVVLNGHSLNENSYAQNVDIDKAFVDKLLSLPLIEDAHNDKNAPYRITSICINSNMQNTNVILGSTVRCLFGQPYICDEIWMDGGKERLKFKVSALSFYQVNPQQTERLYQTALDFAQLTKEDTVWDLYCGIGTISLFLAKKASRVKGVEIVPAAIADAKENAALNGISNAEFYCGKAEEVFPACMKAKQQGNEFACENEEYAPAAKEDRTVVVLDPPRKGCDKKLLDAIMQVGPAKIVYVSCDPATLARDIKILTGGASSDGSSENENMSGEALSAPAVYRVEKVQPIDMFPNSVHVETVVSLVRKKPDTYIDLKIDMDELDLTASEAKATYEEIKNYVAEKYDVKVSTLYIAQVKAKHGIIERENYNKPKSDDGRVPQCTPEKEEMIEDALRHFKMI